MRYFITGGAGFIGSSVCARLLAANTEDRVTVFDNLSFGRESYIAGHYGNPRFRFVKGDLLEPEAIAAAVKGHDLVFHFAANADISKAMTQTDLDVKLTILATYNLLEAMRLGGVRRIVYSSGSGVYGDVGTTETAEGFGPLLPISLYGASKLGAEGLISAFSHMFDMQAWIFRFANVIGGRQTHGVILDFINRLKADPRKLDILGNGTQSKSYIHISDIMEAIFFVVERGRDRVNLFNVATDDYITVREIAELVVGALKLQGVELNFSEGDRGWKGDVPVVRFDLGKIHALGWRANHGSRAAVERTIREILEIPA